MSDFKPFAPLDLDGMLQTIREFHQKYEPKPDDAALLIVHPRKLDQMTAQYGAPTKLATFSPLAGLPIETDDWHSLDHFTVVLNKQKAAYDRHRKQHRPMKAIFLAGQEVPAKTEAGA